MKLLARVVVLLTAVATAVIAVEEQPCDEKWSDGGMLLHRADVLHNSSDSRLEVRILPLDANVPTNTLFVVVEAVGNYSGKIEGVGTWIASASQVYAPISPSLFDLLTLGALGVSERYNRVLRVEVTTTPLCKGRAADVMRRVVQSILNKAAIDSTSWTIQQYNQTTTLENSQVFVFMATGLISVFSTFITVPFLSLIFFHACQCRCCKKIRITDHNGLMKVLLKSLYVVAALFDTVVIVYWIVMAFYYYQLDAIGRVLFPHALLSPFSVALIFYFLTTLTTFFGGICSSKCSNSCDLEPRYLDKIGFGFASVSLSTGVFHSFYFVLAFIQDAVTVTVYLTVLGTILLLLFFSIASVGYQYQKARLRGFFSLVVILNIIIFVLYIISVKAFGKLLLVNCLTATTTWLVIVTLLSSFALSFSLSVFALIVKQPAAASERETNQPPPRNRRVTEVDVERAENNYCRELVPKKTALTKSQQVELVRLLPAVVETWKKREKMRGGVVTPLSAQLRSD